MSSPIAPGGPRTGQKTTCPQCRRTVVIVQLADGQRTTVDPEVTRGVPWPSNGKPDQVTFRRSHAEMCARYKHERELAQAKGRKTP